MPSIDMRGREGARVGEILCNAGLHCTGQVHAFGQLSPDGVVLVGRDRDRGENADNRDNDHQFNKGEALLESAFMLKWLLGA